eukprot:TRINITY_DN2620_c1_g2_i1.p1 TRINITY_DN2620_c1_g2~~TRINITY_DN2620_c1_g2_i1.p1  ORF type:complete len:979 (+),score=150.18 TRINITY_DN2620_c1_g2_i1:123-3059(+)
MPSRIIVVSNRLPVSIHPTREAPNDVEQSSGGLVSALRRVAASQSEELVWIGWPGCTVSNEAEEERLAKRLAQESSSIKLVPVWLSQGDVEDFYNGYSNSSLWPLLHWMTTHARFKRTWFESYCRVNKKFADVVLATATPEDLIWIHDYHLFLLPQMLRQRLGEVESTDGRKPWERSVREDASRGDDSCDNIMSPLLMAARPEHLPPPIEDEMPGPIGEQVLANAGFSSRRHGVSDADSFAGLGHCVPPRNRGEDEPRRDKLKIAFFLHTPFPTYEVICILPQCSDIIEGVLGADIVGFHTYSYLRHFRSCVVRLCGLTTEIDQIVHLGQRSMLEVFPIGANWQDITEAMESDQFSQELQDYTKQYEGKSLVLSVERLDYSKGMPQKLAAIERYLEQAEIAKKRQTPCDDIEEDSSRSKLLEDLDKRFKERNSDQGPAPISVRRMGSFKSVPMQVTVAGKEEVLDHSKTVFVFIAVPSRQSVREYQEIEEEVHRSVSTINGRFSTPTHQPIVYIHRAVSAEELAALYARADCCLVTPLIDGMNLVAKEFIAAKNRSVPNVVPGTVVLSELAGAAQELFDSIVVNPYDEDGVANAITVSLELTRGGLLDEESRWEVTGRMREFVLMNDSVSWARSLLNQLKAVQPMLLPRGAVVQRLPDTAAHCFSPSVQGTKALFLDYDGTLRELAMRPEDAVPSEEALQLFSLLNKREDLRVFIVSGRKQEFLEEHFHPFDTFTLVAEHGFVKRGPDTNHEWRMLSLYTSTEWMSKVMPIMQLYERCTPGSVIEPKCSAIVWHYRECDEEYGKFKAKELMHQLALSLGNLPCEISQGHKIIEVSSMQVKKGPIVKNACKEQMAKSSPFVQILCVGDDSSDESMFLDAPLEAWTVKVGDGETYARHSVQDPEAVRRFLFLVAQGCELSPVAPETANRDTFASYSGRDAYMSCSDWQDGGRDAFKSCTDSCAVQVDDNDVGIDLPEFEM